MTGKVSFTEWQCDDEKHSVGIATLENEASLNALTFDMLVQLKDQLDLWKYDPKIVCILLQGAGEKAFCAGGDVRTMHNVMRDESKADAQAFCIQYFTVEYQCDYLIHTYPKPIVVWGEGIVMGGGMGLFMGGSHKVVTPKSRLAMPEINIGLYPDVGGTWFLNRLEPGIGLFLGLTGALVNATDAVDIHLADHLLLPETKDHLLAQLQATSWQEHNDHHSILTTLLNSLAKQAIDHKPENQLMHYFSEVQQACDSTDLETIRRNILAISPDSESTHKWLDSAKHALKGGSPITAHICFRQMTQHHHLSLADCFRLELGLSAHCGILGEFQEGVRARLIDKSGEPQWLFSSIGDVDTDLIEALFTSLWSKEQHPLAQLGIEFTSQ
ncbi:enoyl-CoA hydratase/isomerase family protein [Vibrio cortegadensis]|uniref:3-hydroxyisobutyryl-CoA hydrolase n=1 Tax=Vibrio cortegadensis TaxID=1328770 RepID=A0ABV4M3J1_9VIBR